jgi:creatinine amidohydrolase
MSEMRWERLFPDELEARFTSCPVLYLPYGMCEPHGPQNVLGLDGLKAHAVCMRAAELGGGIVAPTEWWHVHELGLYAAWAHREIGEVQRKWLTAVPPWVHFKNVCYHIRAADQLGFKAVILLTGHYGPNWMDLKTIVQTIQPHIRARLFGLPDFEAAEPGFDGDGKTKDHAGKVETSLLWALEPECVDVSRMPPRGTPSATGHHFAMGRDAYDASRLMGERLAAYEADFLVKVSASLVRSYEEAPAETPAKRICTFGDVESFWEERIVPILSTFASMEGYAAATSEVSAIPAESVWKASSRG